MTTARPRIQVTLDNPLHGMLAVLAKKHRQSTSALAADLIREALALREDRDLSEMSNQRIAKDDGKRYSHAQAWGE
jgi:hypothetical protein